uniref:Tripartite motif containing 39 n=1 Tax=Pelodiscus sinensis TaxID=13735 RepID=K7FDV2_PELSI
AMAAGDLAGSFQEEVTCPICLEYFTDPVIIECGHNFCRACLSQCWGESEPNFSCPRSPVNWPSVRLTEHLTALVQLQVSVPPDLGSLGRRRSPATSQRRPARVTRLQWCEAFVVREAHRAWGAAQRSSCEKLQEALGPLREQLEDALALRTEEEEKTTTWQVGIWVKRETIAGEFNKLHTLLKEEEQLLLQRLVEEERETLQRLQENVSKLSQQSSSLQQLIAEIEGKCQQPVAELLKDVKSTLSRSENMKLQEPEDVCTDLQRGYKICLDLREALNRFAVDVTLDPDTANRYLVLSEDRKRVRHGDTRQDLPDNPERFEKYPIVLGTEGFAGGRRYWEVEVGDKTAWDLGVCRESVSRKGKVTYSPKKGYWVMFLRDGGYKPSPSTPLPVSARPSRVGVFLDYEAGEVSFYNVTDRSHLFTFTGTFSGTLRPFFCPCSNAGGTNAAPLTISPVPAQAGGDPCP